MASPSTSITDVSSNNCTPQHGGGELTSTLGKRVRSNNFTSNSLSRPGHAQSAKVTTTFGPNNGLYSTVKTGGPDNMLRTFGDNETFTKKNQQQSLRKIEENNYETVMRPSVAPLTNGLTTRTMERRHIKNSEI